MSHITVFTVDAAKLEQLLALWLMEGPLTHEDLSSRAAATPAGQQVPEFVIGDIVRKVLSESSLVEESDGLWRLRSPESRDRLKRA